MQQVDLVESRNWTELERKQVPPVVTVNGQELQFVNWTRIGPFVWVHLIDEKTKVHGFGGSKQSAQDKFNFQQGLLIALGRAEKAIRLKKNKKGVTHPYMS